MKWHVLCNWGCITRTEERGGGCKEGEDPLVYATDYCYDFVLCASDVIYSSCAPENGVVSLGLVILPINIQHMQYTVAKATTAQVIRKSTTLY